MKRQMFEGILIVVGVLILIVSFAILLNNIIKVNRDIANFELEHRILDSQLDTINSRLDKLESIPVVRLESDENE